MEKIPLDFNFPVIEHIVLEENTVILKSETKQLNTNKVAWMERGYNSDRMEYYMLNSFFEEGISKWVEDVKVPLVKGKGIPLSLYLDLRLMKLLNVPNQSIKYFIIYNVYEWDSIFKLAKLIKENPSIKIDELIKHTKIFQSRENVIIQTGYTIEDIRIILDNSLFTHPKHLTKYGLTENAIEKLCEIYHITYDEQIFWNFSIVIKVKNAFR